MAGVEGHVPLPDGRIVRYLEQGEIRTLFVTPADGGPEVEVAGDDIEALEAEMAGLDATDEVTFTGDTPPSGQRS